MDGQTERVAYVVWRTWRTTTKAAGSGARTHVRIFAEGSPTIRPSSFGRSRVRDGRARGFFVRTADGDRTSRPAGRSTLRRRRRPHR